MAGDKLELRRASLASLNRQELAKSERTLEPVSSDRGQIKFERYPDGVLMLYKRSTLVGDTPAGYSEENVVVRIHVKPKGKEHYVVIIPTTRTQLDTPGYEQFLERAAWEWRHP